MTRPVVIIDNSGSTFEALFVGYQFSWVSWLFPFTNSSVLRTSAKSKHEMQTVTNLDINKKKTWSASTCIFHI